MQSSVFHLGSIKLRQSGGAWKVGTDSVLLGCWMSSTGTSRVLDVGTGSGILSLMLVVRNAQIRIDAVEIAEAAIAEARVNIEQNGMQDRIELIRSDIWDYCLHSDVSYDIVVCNPPYHTQHLKAITEVRRAARQGEGFTVFDLPAIAKASLVARGKLVTVLPSAQTFDFIEVANAHGLYAHRRLQVRHSAEAEDALTLLELKNTLSTCETTFLTLYTTEGATEEFRSLCREFLSV